VFHDIAAAFLSHVLSISLSPLAVAALAEDEASEEEEEVAEEEEEVAEEDEEVEEVAEVAAAPPMAAAPRNAAGTHRIYGESVLYAIYACCPFVPVSQLSFLPPPPIAVPVHMRDQIVEEEEEVAAPVAPHVDANGNYGESCPTK